MDGNISILLEFQLKNEGAHGLFGNELYTFLVRHNTLRRNVMSLGQDTNNCDIPGSGRLISVMPQVEASNWRDAPKRANVCCDVPEGRAAGSCDVPEVGREGVGKGKFE